MSKEKSSNWWESFYEDTPFEIFMERKDNADLEANLDFLVDVLELSRGDRVFDQCCGFGSLSVPLFERGYRVVGVDLCEKYIEIARSRTKSPLKAAFHCADAFKFTPKKSCDGAFNWYTSFGYSERDDENILMLKRAFESLKPGKKFAIEYPNMAFLLTNFKSAIRSSQDTPAGIVELVRQCKMDMEKGVLRQVWNYKLPDGRTLTKETGLRIYLPHSIGEMLKTCGFVDVTLYGGFDRTPVSLASPRCIITARRPK